MSNIFATHALPGASFEALTQQHKVTIFDGPNPPTQEELCAGVKDADVLICLLRDPIDKAVIKAGKRLQIIANYAVGTNNIAIEWATMRDIVVLNTPHVLTDATAEHAFALMLGAARRIGEGDRLLRESTWQGWEPNQLLGTQVTGKTLGLIGMGHIGRAMARMARGFGMQILYHNRHRLPLGIEREVGASYRKLDELLQESDFVSLHCPLTPETQHLLNAQRISQMKRGAILINTARGPIVDEEALVEALQSGHLAAAGLDVYEQEPTLHPALRTLPQALLSPHLGSATHETRIAMTNTLLDGIHKLLQNQRPANIVNSELMPTS